MTEKENSKGRESTPEELRKKLGKLLSSSWTEKGYTRESLSQKTKVPLKALEELEQGHVNFYQERLYARGFLTLICRQLEISDKDILSIAEQCGEKTFSPPAHFMEQEPVSRVKNLKTKTLFGLKSFLLFLVILGSGVAFFFYRSSKNELSKTSPKLFLEKNVLATPAEEPCRKKLPDEFSSSDNVNCLTLHVKRKSSFSTEYDNKKMARKPYPQGIYHFYYTDKINFLFDDARNVELIVKGKNWGPISLSQGEKSLSFSGDKPDKKPFPSS